MTQSVLCIFYCVRCYPQLLTDLELSIFADW
nr:MAG TPA: hypothetical protein [Bacteriophage sp.]DAS83229.1 MAG TPA: hypothetical protein [Caudoviricetes sp.]DAZ80818.1 MAG TPA: hypothetical protein [Caudoviricetes sp.]